MTNIETDESVDRITENFETEETEEIETSETYKARMMSETYKIHNEKLNEVLLQFMDEEELIKSIEVS